MKKQNLSGRVFGRLVVIKPAKPGKGRAARSLVWCTCGVSKIVLNPSLLDGCSKSCGCLQSEKAGERLRKRNLRHGMYGTPTYKSWIGMGTRCTNRNTVGWKIYGGAGVTVCTRWRKFENFLADMGIRPEGTTLGRYGDAGNYQPENCAWQTPAEQGLERRKKFAAKLAA